MGQISLLSPTVGQPNLTEEPKIASDFVTIQNAINGNLDTTNLAPAAGITTVQLASGSDGLAAESFSAWRRAALSVPNASTTVIPFDNEEWDLSSRYDTATGRYTPQVSGYYRLSALAHVNGLSPGESQALLLYKNGAVAKSLDTGIAFAVTQASVGSVLVFANGSTDYFDIRLQHSHASACNLQATQAEAFFQGELIGKS